MLNRKDYRKYLVKAEGVPCWGCALLYTDNKGFKKCKAPLFEKQFDCWDVLENGDERHYIFKLIKKEKDNA